MTKACPRCGGVRFVGGHVFVSPDLLAIPTRRCSRRTCRVDVWNGLVVADRRGRPTPEMLSARLQALAVEAARLRGRAQSMLEEADEIDEYIKNKKDTKP